ncbi:hypothetical protein N7519_004101 [Penicillium mononematosum]|uniref:uncharacterized protein n=1 Tax=Penicillium mononematosum TaxID=268346 RepID=UPI002546D535|nr:uncharacterized protein N7519_004101 [Penicillium mononematosum]KAJ6189193.1 hypothetical protein N7519_004101 [Penicillium mononematosum]
MAITNTIHIEAHVGSVDGISVIWSPNSAYNLSSNDNDYNVRRSVFGEFHREYGWECTYPKATGRRPSALSTKVRIQLEVVGAFEVQLLPSPHPLPFADALHSSSSYTNSVTFRNLYRWDSASEIGTRTSCLA